MVKATDQIDEAIKAALNKLGMMGVSQDTITALQLAALVSLMLHKGIIAEGEWGMSQVAMLERVAGDIQAAKERAEIRQRLLS